MSTRPAEPAHAPSRALRWLGLAMVLAPLLVRATSAVTNLPFWDLDPTIFPLNSPAIGPAGSMLVDVTVLLGAALLLAAEALARHKVSCLLLGLGLVGSVACLVHGWWTPSPESAAIRGSLGNQRVGVAWLSAIWSALAIGHAARDEHIRRVGLGVLLAFVGLLALRGVQEVYVEHAATMAGYKADPQRFIESRGWTMDSSMAKQFIRRISQPEASGWFGLSNVYASFAAFGSVASLAWVLGAWRDRRSRGTGACLPAAMLALLLSLLALFLSDSKGGVAFAALGVFLLFASAALHRRLTRFGWLPSATGPACLAAVLGAIAARGIVGERIHELSILFRAFYIEAALRIFMHRPMGVGPDGFQAAYLLAKNPLNPEEVQSPHSILFDWLATLGIAGIAWCAIALIASVRLGRNLFPSTPAGDRGPDAAGVPQQAAKAGMLIIAAATIVALWFQSPFITPDAAAVRLAGLLIGCAIVFAAARGTVDGVWPRRGLAAAALALLAHAQIDVTMSVPAAAGLALAACGLAAAPSEFGRHLARPSRPAALTAALLVAFALFIAWAGCLPAWRWQRSLASAAEQARVVAIFGERAAALQSGKQSPLEPRDSLEKFTRDLGAELGRPVPQTSNGVTTALLALDRKHLPAAAAELERAMTIQPSEWRIAREASRLYLRLASGYLRSQEPESADLVAERAVRVITPPLVGGVASGSAAWLRAMAVVEEGYGRERNSDEWLRRGYQNLKRVTELDPYNLDVVVRLFKLSARPGLEAEHKRWAVRALELDQLARLDREVKGLGSADRGPIEAAASR